MRARGRYALDDVQDVGELRVNQRLSPPHQIELIAVPDHGNERRDQLVQQRMALDLPSGAEFTLRIAQDEGHGQPPRVAPQDHDPMGG
jgi:hypothetical protein